MQRLVDICFEQVSHIKVKMLRNMWPLRNDMLVDIKNRRIDYLQGCQATLFGSLLQGDLHEIFITVGMSAQLQPAPQLAVKREQGVRPPMIDHPRRSSKVPFETLSLISEWIVGELRKIRDKCRFFLVGRPVNFELLSKRNSIHLSFFQKADPSIDRTV